MNRILANAAAEGRTVLLEPEVYEFMERAGLPAPQFHLIRHDETVTQEIIDRFHGDKIVLKVVSPDILHKSDVRGVRILAREINQVQEAVSSMLQNTPGYVAEHQRQHPEAYPSDWRRLSGDEVLKTASSGLAGILLVEYLPPDLLEFGSELLMGIRHTREYGPVLTFGVGGLDAEFYQQHFRAGASHVIRATGDLDADGLQQLLQQPAIHQKLAGKTRDRKVRISDEVLYATLSLFQRVAQSFADGADADYTIEEFEINPLVVRAGKLVPLDGLLRFRKAHPAALPRPLKQIDRLLNARSVALIGVSQKMNVGHIILKNLLDYDYDPERLFLVKPDLDELDGVHCYPTVDALPEKVDMFVICVDASQVRDVIGQIFTGDKAASILLIPGGVGEKSGTEGTQQMIQGMIHEQRLTRGEESCVVNGGNCLGVYSRPAGYSTLFIPEYKLPRPISRTSRKFAYISQSGAFMIARMSKLPFIDPEYAISTGNQIDLTIGDYLEYVSHQDIDVVAVYVEGFQPGDGLKTARVARSMIRSGKTVLIYKSGRTQAGKAAASGHTASIAGDYPVFQQVMQATGARVATSFTEFEYHLIYEAFLAHKPVRGNRVALLSNAGFETVGLADNVEQGVTKLAVPAFSAETEATIQQIFKRARLQDLVDVHNPLDLTPMASDAVWKDVVEALLQDEATDMVVVAIVPLTAAMQTLSVGDGHREDITSSDSFATVASDLASRYDKPFVVSVDSGTLYDAYADAFFNAGIPVFRSADEAIRFLGTTVKITN